MKKFVGNLKTKNLIIRNKKILNKFESILMRLREILKLFWDRVRPFFLGKRVVLGKKLMRPFLSGTR